MIEVDTRRAFDHCSKFLIMVRNSVITTKYSQIKASKGALPRSDAKASLIAFSLAFNTL